MSKKKTHDEFIIELSEVTETITVLSKYNGNKVKVKCECGVCGNIWDASPSHLLNKHGCPECAKKNSAEKNTWSHSKFLEELNKVNTNITVIGQYVKTRIPIDCVCKICGHKWSPKPYILLSGRGCPECGKKIKADKHRLSEKEFLDRVYNINPNIEIIGKYVSRKSYIETKCKVCGHIWSPSTGNLIEGYGCPICNHSSTSYPEQYIFYMFISIFGENNVISRDKSVITKELDIYIPSKKIAIEYGSWHWHKDKLEEDKNKIKLCRDKGIKLITILDNCPKDFSEDSFWCYYEKIERDDTLLHNLICRLLKEIDMFEYFDMLDFQNIEILARKMSCKKSTNDFISELETINDKIVVNGEYKNSKEKIEVECTICNHKWKAIPSNLLNGVGCPKCNKKGPKKRQVMKIKDEVVLKIFSSINDAAKDVDYSSSTIRKYCLTGKTDVNGFNWRFLEEKE